MLTQTPGQSNLKSVKVSLPQTLAALLPVVNRACTLAEYQAGRCRKAQAGSAVARTPLLKDPLRGGAFFVRHPGRPLPDLMVALRGDIDIDLVGRVTIPGGTRLATNFDTIPDAPVSKFTLNIVAGSHGPLGVSTNLCSKRGKRSTADVTMRGQNGAVITRHPRLHIRGCGGTHRTNRDGDSWRRRRGRPWGGRPRRRSGRREAVTQADPAARRTLTLSSGAMGPIVIKLGSSIVADDEGQPRADVLAHVCEQAAALHRAGHDVAIVTSGAIARGMGVMRFAERPTAMDELQAASAVGQGKLYAVYDELLRGHGIASAQVLLTFHDLSGERAHYLNARQTLRKLLDWRVVPVVNENDTTATDEITFGDNDFLAAQVAILIGARAADPADLDRRPLHGRPAARRRRRAGAAGRGLRRARVARHPPDDDDARLGRDALEGRRGRDGDRGRIPAVDRERAARRARSRPPSPASRSARASRRRRSATRASSCGSSTRSPRAARSRSTPAPRARCARAARACCRSGSSRSRASSSAGDAVDVVHDGAAVGKGIASCSAADLQRVMGLKSEQARELLPTHDEEAIHRDHFVLA